MSVAREGRAHSGFRDVDYRVFYRKVNLFICDWQVLPEYALPLPGYVNPLLLSHGND